jgi:hypothetical protein
MVDRCIEAKRLSNGAVRPSPVGGPDNFTLNELARAVQSAAARTSPPRHVPRPMLRLTAATIGRAKPEIGRQTRAALVMDRVDLGFDDAPLHRDYPELPTTSLADVLGHTKV